LDDPEEVIKQKINIIEHRNVFSNYGEFLFDNDFVDTLPENLTLKEIDHLRNLIFQKMIDVLKPIQEKIKYYGEHKEEVENLLER
jgi:tryptophanyl-tRNA synthetase